jgi:hypothetical protein
VGEDEKERGVKMGRVLLIISQLTSQIVPRFIERMNFIDPEGLLVKGVEPQNKTYEKTEKKDKNFFLSCFIQSLNSDLQRLPHFLAMQKIETPNGNEKYLSM